ncbi:hypothetical protein F5Y03DRAFT_360949 [Xylaria venustula]|nr:hypothetical protein F5Y03DRAFT_360949 [Xylaria venustula]
MVGVPGRSKGCSTCRTRKKGCDRKRPVCTQCTCAGLECGGYERKRIFLNYTQCTEAKAVSVVYRKEPKQGLDGVTNIVLHRGLVQTAYVENYISIFMGKYLPANRLSRDWVEIAYDLHPSDQAIRLSFLCLGLFAAGELQFAVQSYCYALRKLHTVLCVPSQAQSNSTLAACKLFSLVEVLHGADKNLLLQGSKWHSHLSGLLAIFHARSPYSYQSGVSHQFFSNGRYPLLVASIANRQRAPLNTQEWRTVPWEKEPKSHMDKLYDIMADLSGILADTDEMRCCADLTLKARLHEEVLKTCQQMDKRLQSWLQEVGPLTNFNIDEEIRVDSLGPPYLPLAHMTLLFWTCHVINRATLISIYDPPLSEIPTEIDPLPFIRKITNALPYFWSTDAGLCGTVLAALPWGISLQIVYATPQRYPEEIRLLEQFIMQRNAANTILLFLESLQRDSAGPEFSSLNGREGLICRAQRWMMAGSRDWKKRNLKRKHHLNPL